MAIADVTCVGIGTVGRSWAVVFLSAGHRVTIFDEHRAAYGEAVRWIQEALSVFESGGFIDSAREASSRLIIKHELRQAVESASYIQESVPEILETKRSVFQDIGRWSPAEAILASSTSQLPGRLFMEDVANSSRALVAHPVNPPHLIPVVELSPTPWTSEETLRRASAFLTQAGQQPIRVLKEISGFIVNRLQMALIGEALHLVGEGYCSPEDLDNAVRFGLGLRWAFMGPFETGHLNAPGGYLEYMSKFRTGMQSLLGDLKVNRQWDEDLIRRIDIACQRVTPARDVSRRQEWRDAQLIFLRKHFSQAQMQRDAD
jgi:L-gulonate 3-dehydrogenase